MADYTNVQFIAFNIKPSYKDEPTKECFCGCPSFVPFPSPNEEYCRRCWTSSIHKCSGLHKRYLGDKNHTQDITNRCKIMKRAIETAYYNVKDLRESIVHIARRNINKIDMNKTLYVFMAPEFYFRGEDGAYPFDQIHTIMEQMREETNFKSYKDWLFVFGTAIGYQKHDVDMEIITAMERTASKTKITLGSLSKPDWKNAAASELREESFVEDGKNRNEIRPTGKTATIDDDTSEEIDVEIKAIQFPGNDDSTIIKLDTTKELYEGEKVVFYKGAKKTRGFRIEMAEIKSDGKTVITIINPYQRRYDDCPDCKCEKFEKLDGKEDYCKNCYHTHTKKINEFIRKNWKAKISRRILTLNTANDFEVGRFVNLSKSKGKTEIGNYAMVCKGGSTHDDANGPAQFVIYKENVSSIDFLRNRKEDWDKGAGRHIDGDQTVLPTEGSRDLLSTKKNIPGTKTTYKDKDGITKEHLISEINKVGYGGGSIFTIDEITFGLEVCLDHAYDRIWNFYNDHFDRDGNAESKQTKSGDPKVQIHLIPSWGMSIGGGEIACIEKGLVFNVDGPKGSILRVNNGSFGCDEHRQITKNSAGNCPKCNKTLKKIGLNVKSIGKKVSVTDKDIKKYFENDGKIVIYEEQKIPKAEVVG